MFLNVDPIYITEFFLELLSTEFFTQLHKWNDPLTEFFRLNVKFGLLTHNMGVEHAIFSGILFLLLNQHCMFEK